MVTVAITIRTIDTTVAEVGCTIKEVVMEISTNITKRSTIIIWTVVTLIKAVINGNRIRELTVSLNSLLT